MERIKALISVPYSSHPYLSRKLWFTMYLCVQKQPDLFESLKDMISESHSSEPQGSPLRRTV